MRLNVEESLVLASNRIDVRQANIGDAGYFSNDKDFNSYHVGYIDAIRDYDTKNGSYGTWCKYEHKWFKYFIIKEAVSFEHRPFDDIKEFEQVTGCSEIGKSIIVLRNIHTDEIMNFLYVGNFGYTAHDVCLGGRTFDFDELYDTYRFIDGEGNEHILGV